MACSERVPSTTDQFVWERWCHVWYMGRIVDETPPSSTSPTHSINSNGIDNRGSNTSEATRSSDTVRVHIHGERETSDKWLARDSPNLVPLTVIASPATAIGSFPPVHALVELYLMDAPLYALLLRAHAMQSPSHATDAALPLLVGRVMQVLPAHDACVVDVLYPRRYHHIVIERRVHIGNGYVNVIPDDVFEIQQLSLKQMLATVGHDTVYNNVVETDVTATM